MSERRGYVPKEYEEEAEDPRIYEEDDEKPSCDKGNHKERSLGNDERTGGHKLHWKKVEKEDD